MGRSLLIVCLLLLAAGCSEPLKVVTVAAENKRLEVSFSERAETILRQDYPIAMPVNGKIARIDLEVGDRVREGEILVSIDQTPARQEVAARQAAVRVTQAQRQLAADTSVEEAELRRARTALGSIRAESDRVQASIQAAKTNLATAQKEEQRISNLVNSGALARRDLDQAQLSTEQARATLVARETEAKLLVARLAEARAGVNSVQAQIRKRSMDAQARESQIQEAQSRQAQADYSLGKSILRSPVDGIVLNRFERGPKELPAGAPILTLGRVRDLPSSGRPDPDKSFQDRLEDLEVECDVLSQDALRIRRGTQVFLDTGDGSGRVLRGEVRLKEPQGFTKRSSLGVEQQRVKVRIGLLDPPPDLGTGYELWARFQIAEKTALALPRSCFVRQGESFQVWRLSGGKLELVNVEIGLKGDKLWELTGTSISSGDQIVRNPNENLEPNQEALAED